MFYREQRWKQRKTKNLKSKESIEFLTVKTFPITVQEKNKSRKEKCKVTTPVQRKLNTRRSMEWHKMLVNTNFDNSDYVIHATFNDNKKPTTKEEIEREFKNYIARINRRRKKDGLGNARYVAVIEGLNNPEKRIHFHIIIDGDLDRDTLEDLWKKKGIINVDRLQLNEEGLTGLVEYITKEKLQDDEVYEEEKYRKAYRTSLGLKKPKLEVNDCKFNKRKLREMLVSYPSRQEIEKMYPGYTLTRFDIKQNDEYGHIYVEIQMRRYVKNKKIKGTNLYKPILR
ncbi:MAG: rolling circle replication-associated protein [Clostridium sp.]|uniref:rolling circle replication-associated protein n=1 Tax=Clostridium sp. TaxID=1506 RepID=UPI003F333D9B